LRDPAAARAVAALGAEVGALADYGAIVPADLIARFPAGILNVHPSLLPRWRGASPIQATIAAGDARAGVSVIAMDDGIDTGPIVATEAWDIGPTQDAPGLRDLAGTVGGRLLAATIRPWVGGAIIAVPQDPAAATMTRRLQRDDGRLDPGRPAVELERLVRALAPWPGCHIETDAGRLIVVAAHRDDREGADPVGTLVRVGDGLGLVTSDGRLVLDTVQPAGGRPMDAAAFVRGRGRALPGTVVHPTRTMSRPWMWTV
jgi:methionyl-tRNA formyltransferase